MPGSTRSPDSPRSPAPSRRSVLGWGLGASAVLAVAGCGTVRVGQPAAYTPPPLGIDDLYRADLLDLLDRLLSATAGGADPREEIAGRIRELHAALVEHRDALLTGAETQKEQDASSASDDGGAQAQPVDAAALVDLLGQMIALGADACVQCSGSLARVVAAIVSHLQWAAGVLVLAAGEAALTAPAPPAEAALVPSREVPTSDPPSVAATVDYEAALQEAQGDEWYAGYALEVMAARATDDATRAPLLDASGAHRDRARRLARIAQEDQLTGVPQEAVYPLPGGGLDEETLAELSAGIGQGLLEDWVAMVGAVPFAHRAFAVASALAEAHGLVGVVSAVPVLPSLSADDR